MYDPATLTILISQYRTMASYSYPSSTYATDGSMKGSAILLLAVPSYLSNAFHTQLFIRLIRWHDQYSLCQSETSSSNAGMDSHGSNSSLSSPSAASNSLSFYSKPFRTGVCMTWNNASNFPNHQVILTASHLAPPLWQTPVRFCLPLYVLQHPFKACK
jgi:hypothetical protein